MIQEFYSAKSKLDSIRSISSSGGMFLHIAKTIIDNNGVVYGAIYDDCFNVLHQRATSYDELLKMTGSKYAKSNISGIYERVKFDLDSNKLVLFTGTPCQVFALKKYLKEDYDNLYTIDVICHGAPNQKYLTDYISYMEEKYNSKITRINMRYKDIKKYRKNNLKKHISLGKVEPHIMMIEFENGKVYKAKSDYDKFYQLFDYFLDKGCFQCPFSNIDRVSDITIGDFHEFSSKLGDFNDGNGISLLIINSDDGKKLFDKFKDGLCVEKKNIKECIQPALQSPAKEKSNYDEFRKDYIDGGFKKIINKYSKHGFKYRIKELLEKIGVLDKLLHIKKAVFK